MNYVAINKNHLQNYLEEVLEMGLLFHPHTTHEPVIFAELFLSFTPLKRSSHSI
jgi:hypothetical protein